MHVSVKDPHRRRRSWPRAMIAPSLCSREVDQAALGERHNGMVRGMKSENSRVL